MGLCSKYMCGRRKKNRFRSWIWLPCMIFLTVKRHDIVAYYRNTFFEPTWVKDSIPTGSADEKTFRCGAEDMGCFVPATTQVQVKTSGGMTQKQCLATCFRRDNAYAAYASGKGCYCAKDIDTLVRQKPCDVACSAENSKNCTAVRSARVFRKTHVCEIGISEASVERQRVGCLKIPVDLNYRMTPFALHNFTSKQCILNCENRGFQLALPIEKIRTCVCSDPFSLFVSPEQMQNASRACPPNTERKLTVTGDELFPLYRTFAPSNGCAPKRFLVRHVRPLTVITSFWGSGNTWLRHLIEVATGIYTGSVYMDDYTHKGGMIGEKLHYTSGRTFVIKDHIVGPPSKMDPIFTSAILIIRNLYDATLAEYARLKSNADHVGVLSPEKYLFDDFQEFVVPLPDKWTGHVERVLNIIPSVLVVYYEDIVRDPVQQIRRVVDFLPSDIVQLDRNELDKRIMCMNMEMTGGFKRSSKGLTSNPYSSKTKKAYEAAFQKLDDFLQSRGMPGLPNSYFDPWKS